MSDDNKTANAFASSWNNLPEGSVYTKEQFEDWIAPLNRSDVEDKNVTELGCGNASLLVHIARWNPSRLIGVDLGDSVKSARRNLEVFKNKGYDIIQSDLIEYTGDLSDVTYCIGVLHHLRNPKSGFDSVVRNTKSGGKFHCWVYAYEGNFLIRYIVDPLRLIVNNLPWWVTKYIIATPLALPFYLYSKVLFRFKYINFFAKLPLYHYSIWIASREFLFYRHVAFDQLVTPKTTYIKRSTIEK